MRFASRAIVGIATAAIAATSLGAQQPVSTDSSHRRDTTSIHVLAPVSVGATVNPVLDNVGFTMRAAHGTGHYLTQQQIAKMSNFKFTDLLRNIPGMQVGVNKYGEDEVRAPRSGGSVLSDSYQCVQYVIDGVVYFSDWANAQGSGNSNDPRSPLSAAKRQMANAAARDLNSSLKRDEILGIEVYTGPGTPAQYNQGGGNCATILVWTKNNVRATGR